MGIKGDITSLLFPVENGICMELRHSNFTTAVSLPHNPAPRALQLSTPATFLANINELFDALILDVISGDEESE